MILRPIVRMMRMPPEKVPREIADADAAITQVAACTSAGQWRFGFAALCGLVGLAAMTRLVIRFDD